ncbi:MAG: hypothetical protein JWM31_57 [Solirubrobacterales bacterium]|nr:hypothetical protein [Solirubrobacterales bacterium]
MKRRHRGDLPLACRRAGGRSDAGPRESELEEALAAAMLVMLLTASNTLWTAAMINQRLARWDVLITADHLERLLEQMVSAGLVRAGEQGWRGGPLVESRVDVDLSHAFAPFDFVAAFSAHPDAPRPHQHTSVEELQAGLSEALINVAEAALAEDALIAEFERSWRPVAAYTADLKMVVDDLVAAIEWQS